MSDRAWPTTSLPQMYFVPRTNALRRVLVCDCESLRVLRTELELLKRVDRLARRTARWGGSVRDDARRFADADRVELADILRNARRPIVREMIAVIDEEFPELRKEIMMSVVNEEAERIVEEAQASGAVGRPVAEHAAAPATDSLGPGASLEDIDAALAAAQSQLASVVDGTDTITTEQGPTDTNPAEVTPTDAAPAEATSTDATPADAPSADAMPADIAPAATAPPDITPRDATTLAPGAANAADTFADPSTIADEATTGAANEADTGAAARPDAEPADVPSTNAAALNGHDSEPSPAAASPEITETASDTVNNSPPETPEESASVGGHALQSGADAGEQAVIASTDNTVNDVSRADAASTQPISNDAISSAASETAARPTCAAPSGLSSPGTPSDDDSKPGFEVQETSMDEPAYPDAASSDRSRSARARNAASTAPGDAFDAYHSPERVERTVAEIERGIRKLAALLSGEVSDQWRRAQEAFAEVADSRETIASAGAEVAPIVAEVKRLCEEAKQTQQALDAATQQAKAFREQTRRAKERAETSAAAAELAADQAAREVESARAASGD